MILTGFGGSPAGSNTQLQFNDGGAFGASASLTWTSAGLKNLQRASIGPDALINQNTIYGSSTTAVSSLREDSGATAVTYAIGLHAQIRATPATNSGTLFYGTLNEVWVPDTVSADLLSGVAGSSSVVAFHGTGTLGKAYAYAAFMDLTGDVGSAYGYQLYMDLHDVTTTAYGVESYLDLTAGSPLTTLYHYWGNAVGGFATNAYHLWADEQGVFRIRADNTYDGVYQAIPALYNPQFTKYTPGAVDHERIVEQWNGNVAEFGTEKGGTGTLRALRFIGAGYKLAALTSNGFVKTSGGDGTLSVDTATYLTSVTAHNLLSATHGDTTAASVVRGDLITGQGASPTWARLAKGTANQVLAMDGTATDVVWTTPSAGSPGGSDTQIQFNDSSAFGGDAGLTYNKTTNVLTNTGGQFVGAGGTVTAITPVVSLTQTWNNGAVLFQGMKFVVTDSASDGNSKFLEFLSSASSKFSVTISGRVNSSASVSASTNLEAQNGSVYVANDTGGFFLGSSADVALVRDAANIFAQRNGTNTQESRVYGYYSSATSRGYGAVKCAKEALTLSGATSATANLIPVGAFVIGVAVTITTTITGASGYQVGDGADADRWGDITGTAVGTDSDNVNSTANPTGYFAAASAITLTAKTSNFTGGVAQVVVFYLTTGAD